MDTVTDISLTSTVITHLAQDAVRYLFWITPLPSHTQPARKAVPQGLTHVLTHTLPLCFSSHANGLTAGWDLKPLQAGKPHAN